MKRNTPRRFTAICLFTAFLTACAGSPVSESTGEFVDNALITTKVKARLAADEQTSALAISVESFKGIVQLSGFVDSPMAATTAARIASEVPGVKHVENKLTVIGHDTPSVARLGYAGS